MKAITLKSGIDYSGDLRHRNDLNYLISENTVWDAFKSGMDVLIRYADRSDADAFQIARSNLRLLHRTLLSDLSYRNALNIASAVPSINGISSTLLAAPDLSAKLITIKNNNKFILYSKDNNQNMALIVSGMANLEHPGKPENVNSITRKKNPWFSWVSNANKNNINYQNPYKEGDLILFNHCSNEINAITSHNKDCVLLLIELCVQTRISDVYN